MPRPALPALVLALALSACQTRPPDEQTDPVDPVGTSDSALSPVDRLVRASMTLRGLRPDRDDVLAVIADPQALVGIVAGYVDDPAFGRVLRDMHHEQLLMRNEDVRLPALGSLEGTPESDINVAVVEEPLALVEHVVMSNEPYTDIVTADYTVANAASAQLWGYAHRADGDEWQRTPFVDGRPGAGILSTSGLWVRHTSNGRNYHRARAALLARVTMCRDFLDSDIPVDGSVDLSDDAVVADALDNNPSCVACHRDLDPLASTLWGFRESLPASVVVQAYDNDCTENPRTGTSDCFPVDLWTESRAGLWRRIGLREPGYFGTPVADLDELGDAIAADPRFAQCTVRRFMGWFSQTDPDQVDDAFVAEKAKTFAANGFDAKRLAIDLVLSEPFGLREPESDTAVGLLSMRPEQAATVFEGLTGFRWATQQGRLGAYELPTTDRYGYRAMSGGVDGVVVTAPTAAMTPVKALMHASFATEAAAWVVREDLASDTPRLLRRAGPEADDATVNAQIVDLLLDVLALSVAADSPEVEAVATLFHSTLADTGDPAHAWTIALSALFQDPRLLHY